MIRSGENLVLGVPVDVERKRIRRINIRIKPDGRVHLSVPIWWATLAQGEEFLLSKWSWVVRTRNEILSRPPPAERPPVTAEDLLGLKETLRELMAEWTVRLGEPNIPWKTRRMKSLWGSCHLRKRIITYSTELVRATREQIEYVVVHELTHLKVPNHGPAFQSLMTARLPEWKLRRKGLRELGRR